MPGKLANKIKKSEDLNPPLDQIDNLLDLYNNKKFKNCEKLARKFTSKHPNYQFGWKMLSKVLRSLGNIEESLFAINKSIELNPRDFESHNNLGVLLKKSNKLEEAETSFKNAIKLNPKYEKTYNKLGVTLYQLGKLKEAKKYLQKAISINPKFAEAYNNLGLTFHKLGNLKRACKNFEQAIIFRQNFVEAYNNLGIINFELGQIKKSEQYYKKALFLHPNYVEAYNNIGNLYKSDNRLKEAEISYNIAINLKPNNAVAFCNLGLLKKDLGFFKEAKKNYEYAVSIRPNYCEAHRQLSLIKKFHFKDRQFYKMKRLHSNQNITQNQKCKINFSLAKAYEDLGDFEKAFKHLQEGNYLRKNELNYNFAKDIDFFSKIKKNHLKISENSFNFDNDNDSFVPIFILGMPRSGTTLVEQIISSHSKVTGAGELPYVDQFGRSIAQGQIVANSNNLLNFKNNYMSKLRNLSKGNIFITDKMPQNFLYIGMIIAVFPKAKIISVKRNPAALCWSNYKQYFPSQHIDYCYSLKDIIRYYNLYEDLMNFWKKFYNDKIFNLNYEFLTENQKTETQKLLNYLNLNWDQKCLSPEKNKRNVVTASNIQVRKKIYQDSSEEWKRYKKFLSNKYDIFNVSNK